MTDTDEISLFTLKALHREILKSNSIFGRNRVALYKTLALQICYSALQNLKGRPRASKPFAALIQAYTTEDYRQASQILQEYAKEIQEVEELLTYEKEG